MHEMIAAG